MPCASYRGVNEKGLDPGRFLRDGAHEAQSLRGHALRRTWSSRAGLRIQLRALLLFLLGSAVTVALFWLEHLRNRETQRADFERHANAVTSELRATLERPLESLQAIAGLFDASDDVSRVEFRTFVKGMLARHSGIRALEWIPIVPGEQRAAYEASARADGLPGFEFKQEGSGPALVRAGSQHEHFPIYYMEPPDDLALGFDVASHPFRRAPADHARASGSVVVSERIRLVEDPPHVYSVAVFHPVKAVQTGKVRGFATEVFRVTPLIGPVVEPAVRQGVGIVLSDGAAPASLRLLFESTPGLAADMPARTTYATRFAFADRTWTVTFVAGAAQEASIQAWNWSLLASGLVMSFLFSLTVAASALIYRLRREVHAALRLGQYTLVERIGEGGMGVVYRAHHAMLRRDTAVKLLPPGRRETADLDRFEREVQLTSQLTHPNTIAIYDYGRTHDGIFYYAMEFVEGISLEELVAIEGPLPPVRAIPILIQVCGALQEAHDRGMVHRDVKPANLMLMERGGIPDFVKVLDFGLAKEVTAQGALGTSATGSVIGTPLYMSPEAITSGVVDARADIYGLGAVAYYLVTGKTVFEGETIVDVCAQHLSATPRPPSTRVDAAIPKVLDRLILRCLEKKPEQRFASAAELARALRAAAGEIGGFSEETARLWWVERGRALVERIASKRRTHIVHEDGTPATIAVALRADSGGDSKARYASVADPH
jgi:serine/threonine-protein kinase